jgi:hypothetical protein
MITLRYICERRVIIIKVCEDARLIPVDNRPERVPQLFTASVHSCKQRYALLSCIYVKFTTINSASFQNINH